LICIKQREIDSQAFLMRDEYVTFWAPPKHGVDQNDNLDTRRRFFARSARSDSVGWETLAPAS
jgi:hypothetical protein